MPEHNVITDPEIHEPKGAAAATDRTVYQANGSGSGAWNKIAGHEFGEMYIPGNATATVINTVDVDEQVVAGWLEHDLSGVTFDTDHLVINQTGKYLIMANCTFQQSGGTKKVYHFHIGLDSGAGYVSHPSTHAQGEAAATSTPYAISLQGIVAATAGDLVGLIVKNETDDTNVTIDEANLTVVFLG
jgi:hypothetical protein